MARQKLGKTGGKRKKTGPKKTGRKRRMSGSGKVESVLMDGLAVSGGLLAANEAAILMGSLFPTLMANPFEVGIAEAAVGFLAAWKGKAGWLRLAGLGFIANGAYTVFKGTGAIGAAPQTMSYNFVNRRAIGDSRIKFVAGPTTRIGSYPNNFSMVAGAKTRKPRYAS